MVVFNFGSSVISNLFTIVYETLINALDPFEFRTHILASSNRGDSMRQRSRFIGVCKKAIPNCVLPFSYATLPELSEKTDTSSHYKYPQVSTWDGAKHTVSSKSPIRFLYVVGSSVDASRQAWSLKVFVARSCFGGLRCRTDVSIEFFFRMPSDFGRPFHCDGALVGGVVVLLSDRSPSFRVLLPLELASYRPRPRPLPPLVARDPREVDIESTIPGFGAWCKNHE